MERRDFVKGIPGAAIATYSAFSAKRLFAQQPENLRTIVLGVPRSGTTALLKAIDAGGIPAFYQDGPNDSLNPGGSWEVNAFHYSKPEFPYIPETAGKAFKMFISPDAIRKIDGREPTHVIMIMRKPEELVASFERLGFQAHKLKQKDYYKNIIESAYQTLWDRPNVSIDCVTFQLLLQKTDEAFESAKENGLFIDPIKARAAIKPELSSQWREWQRGNG